MTANTWSTGAITTSTTGVLVPAGTGDRPKAAPSGLLVTRAVETKDGWLGHLIIDGEIVYQTKPHAHSDDAMAEVNGRVVARLKKVFG